MHHHLPPLNIRTHTKDLLQTVLPGTTVIIRSTNVNLLGGASCPPLRRHRDGYHSTFRFTPRTAAAAAAAVRISMLDRVPSNYNILIFEITNNKQQSAMINR